jgi:hypothetical protein
LEPIRNYHRNEAHRHPSFATVAHHELAGAPGTGLFVRALGGAFPDATTLYLVGAQWSPTARAVLQGHSEWTGTTIPAGTDWPEDWYEAARVRLDPDAWAALAALADAEGLAALGTSGALFRHDDLLAEWLATRGASAVELLELTSAIPAARLRRLALALGAVATEVALNGRTDG